MSVSAEKQTNLSGHKWHVCQLEFSPSGLHLASASWDKTVRIWDLSTLESMFVLRHHRNPVTCLSWQPRGAAEGHLGRLASGSADGTVALWSGETGKLLQSISHHKGWVLGTSFSSGGDLLASAGWDKTVCLSDVRTGRLIHRLVGHTTGVWNCVFQTSGISTNLLCSGADDGSLKIWDTRMANSVMSLVGAHDDSVKSCAWSPDGGYIASGAADNKHPQMIIPGSLKDRLSQGLARVDGRSLDQEHIALWEPRSGTLLIKLRAHEDAVNEIQFYPVISSKSVPIIFSVGDNSCRVWHPLRKRSKQLQIIKQHRLGLEVEALALSPDGTLLATGARDKDIILSSLDVSLTEVDALPIEDQSEAAINKGATLWKKYTKKVMQKIMSETSDSDSSQSPRNAKNTASLVGRAVYKTEQKPKVNGIFKDSQHTVVEVNGEKSTDGVIKDHRAKLRKSSRPQDSTEAPVKSTNGLDDAQSDGIITDHRARLRKTSRPDGNEEHSKATNGRDNHTQSSGIPKHPRGILRKSSQPDSTGSEDNSTNEFDLVRQRLRHVELQNGHDDVDINGSSYSIFDENGLYPKRNGYHSHNDSSSVSSSSYYGDIEDVAKEMCDLANGVADSRL